MELPAEVIITLLRRQIADLQWQNTLYLAELYAAGLRSDDAPTELDEHSAGE